MYQSFYGLRKDPFNITPDPAFLFLSPSHKEALGSVIYGVERRQGFIAITGEVGLGKTTILRAYLEKVNHEKIKVIYLFNTNVSFEELLKAVCRELDLEIESNSPFEMVTRLHQYLIDQYKSGRNVVLIIDEAQNMPVATLENLRMLSNLETTRDKLIQIVLIGQPELDEKLGLQELRQLRQRIAVRAAISPLTRSESISYMEHRLRRASTTRIQVFTPAAVALIARHAGGIPRIMNIVGGMALASGMMHRQRPIDAELVKEVIAEFGGKRKAPHFLRWGLVSSLIVLLLAGILWGGTPLRERLVSGVRYLTQEWEPGAAAFRPAPPDRMTTSSDSNGEAGADRGEAGSGISANSPPQSGSRISRKIEKPPEPADPR